MYSVYVMYDVYVYLYVGAPWVRLPRCSNRSRPEDSASPGKRVHGISPRGKRLVRGRPHSRKYVHNCPCCAGHVSCGDQEWRLAGARGSGVYEA